MTRIRLIVGLKTSHRTYLTITKTRKGRPRPDMGCDVTDDDDVSHGGEYEDGCLRSCCAV
jgi:hypothetical protein